MSNHLRYPIGPFEFEAVPDSKNIAGWIDDIRQLPKQITDLTQSWSVDDFQRTYRPEGWTGAQVIHHLADSHMNAYIRFKLALTEELPTIKPYNETVWAEMPDSANIDPKSSLAILSGLHHRWAQCLDDMSTDDFERAFYHPELERQIPLIQNLKLYSWHSRHHLGHLELISRK